MKRNYHFGLYATIALLLTQWSPICHAVDVAVYSSSSSGNAFVGRLGSMGYTATRWSSPTQITPAMLADVDVLYVHTGSSMQLDSQASVIADWVADGNGLIVEQPNFEGPIGILPAGLEISVFGRFYQGSNSEPDPVRAVEITAIGESHPITAGLSTADLIENFDIVREADVAPGYDILGVQATNSSYVALAAADFGGGRIVFHTGNTSPSSISPGADIFVERMIDWAAVPEPSSLVLAAICLAMPAACRRRTGRQA